MRRKKALLPAGKSLEEINCILELIVETKGPVGEVQTGLLRLGVTSDPKLESGNVQFSQYLSEA